MPNLFAVGDPALSLSLSLSLLLYGLNARWYPGGISKRSDKINVYSLYCWYHFADL